MLVLPLFVGFFSALRRLGYHRSESACAYLQQYTVTTVLYIVDVGYSSGHTSKILRLCEGCPLTAALPWLIACIEVQDDLSYILRNRTLPMHCN